MVGAGGLEPLTSSVSGRRSNQLSYAPIYVNSGENPNGQYNPTGVQGASVRRDDDVGRVPLDPAGVRVAREETWCLCGWTLLL